MDGTNRMVLHDTRVIWPNALTIDLISQRLYWADAKLRVIEASHLDGSHRRVIAEQILHPFSMTIFGQYIYYTDWYKSGVLRVNRLTDDHDWLIKTSNVTSMGIRAVHPSLQQQGGHCLEFITDYL